MLSLNIKPIYLISAYEFIWESKTWHLPPDKKEVQSLEKQGKNNLLFQGCWQSHLFFNQKIAAKDPEKNIPSTEAKATILSPKEALKHKRKQEALLGNRGIYLRIKRCLNLDCSQNKEDLVLDQQASITYSLWVNPVKGPLSLFLDTGHRFNSIEKMISAKRKQEESYVPVNRKLFTRESKNMTWAIKLTTYFSRESSI